MAAMAATAVAAMCIYLYFVDPTDGPAAQCMLRRLTGYDCPGCGTQRALHALLHGHPAEAWRYNPAALPAIALAALYAAVEMLPGRMPRLERLLMRPAFIYTLAAAIVAWWILRNVYSL